VQVLLGADAPEAQLFHAASKGAFVHLATHGLAQEYEGQSFSALALTMPAQRSDADNGFLTLEDLLARWRDRLSSCRMIVLSACRTAIGAGQRDEAPHALPLGFLYAGASSVIASLWSVQDQATAELMSDFYRRLQQAGPDADRLLLFTEARKALAKKHPDPFFWAPFLYYGSPE